MKKFIFWSVCLLMVGCDQKPPDHTNKIEIPQMNNAELSEMEYKGHEYLVGYLYRKHKADGGGPIFTHSGGCKVCWARSGKVEVGPWVK